MSELQDFAEKAGQEILDYTIDYTEEMDAIDPDDRIISSTWEVTTGTLVLDNGALYEDKTATVWVSGGGNAGTISRLTNTVNTFGGRTYVRVLIVKMVTKLACIEEEPAVVIPTD